VGAGGKREEEKEGENMIELLDLFEGTMRRQERERKC
jgi:hypothetical protein